MGREARCSPRSERSGGDPPVESLGVLVYLVSKITAPIANVKGYVPATDFDVDSASKLCIPLISMGNPHVSAHNEEFSDADFISKSCKKNKLVKCHFLTSSPWRSMRG